MREMIKKMNDAVEAYRRRRQKRLDGREFRESDRLRDEKGRFAPTGAAEIPEKIQKIVDKSYLPRDKKIEEMNKSFGRMKIGSKFHLKDEKGVLHRFEKVDKGDDGWEMRIKTNTGWSQPQKVKRSFMSARILAD